MITYVSKLDMRPGSVIPVLHVSQYDSDFVINFDLWASSGDFVIESGTTATVRGTKLDGNAYSANCTLNGKRVTVEGDIQMTAIAGQQVFEITLHNGEKELNSANFILDVERAAMDKDTFTSDSDILEAYAIVDRTDEIVAAAKKVENAVSSIDETIATELVKLAKETNIGLSDRSKIALLNCLRHLAWIDGQGQSCYEELEDALYEQDIKAVVSIDAVFTQGSLIVYEETSLESLRDYLTVTATYTDQSTKEVFNYTLNGTLKEGTSTVTVEYGSKRDTFSVVVSGSSGIDTISAIFDSGDVDVYTDDEITSLKQYLVVTCHYMNGTSAVVNDYTLSGSLSEGQNVINVTYVNKETTFSVTAKVRGKIIQASFDCGNDYPYDDWDLNAIKKYLTVKAKNGETETTLNDEDYNLSGSLNSSISGITITYLNLYSTVVNINVKVGRYLTAADVESSLGYSNFAVSDNGTMSCDSAESHSGVILKPSIKHIRYTFVSASNNVFWNILGKISQQNSSFYGTDTTKVFQFTEGANKYTAAQTDTASYTSNTPDITVTGSRIDQKIEGGYLVITGAVKYSIQTQGIECLGKWGFSGNPNILKEVKVYE